MSRNEEVLDDIRAKIDREQKLIQGFQSMKRNTNNADVIQRCNTQIRETQTNIEFLQETLEKVKLQSEQASPERKINNEEIVKPNYSRFDLIKYDCPSLGHKIQYMLQQLQFKLQVENQYREANQKISHLYLMDGDKSSSNAAEGGKVESDQRINLLNKALKKYQVIHINVDDLNRDFEIVSTPKHARKELSGKLTVNVTCVRDIDHFSSPLFSKKIESIIVIKIDDVEKARTKTSRSDRWNEDLVIDVEKGNEIEFSVLDKVGNNFVPVAVNWALLSDITEEIRKKKVSIESGTSGWYTANNLPQSSGSSIPGSGSLMNKMDPNSLSSGLNNYNSPSPFQSQGIPSQESSNSIETNKIQINTWLSLEPVGQILLTLSFEKANLPGGKTFGGAIGRHGAIKQKKEEVYEHHGHQFVQKQFYNIMCCALCGEFLRYTGYQCQDCKFLCHKKCYTKVVTKCISKSSTEADDEAMLNHRIPHRFEPVANRGTKWCCHCGHILPWGKKNVRKCSECGVMCHTYCTHLVPDLCGMSMEMANKILATIKQTKLGKQPGKIQKPISPNKQNKLQPPLPNQMNQPSHTISQQQSPVKPFINVIDTSTPDNLSDDEQDTRLPTESRNTYQEPIDNNRQDKRAPPPVPSKNTNEFQKEFQNEINPSRSQEQASQNPFADTENKNASNAFNNFDYNNSNSQPLIGVNNSEAMDIHGVSQNQRPQQAQNVPVKTHKHKKKRRKIGLDDFQFLAVLGKGNFGKVMLAESRHTSQLCAIKVLKKDFIVENDEAESVKSEKRVFLTANKERHPFLLNLHCCFQTENRIYFVMEYISGGDLMWHIQKARFSSKRAKFYACEVLLGLKYFHDNGIVYRDLKLDNILLTVTGHIKIGDYGLCKENMWHKSTTGTFCGTPEFMAPEIIAGKQYDRSVDWWAFGVLLFQMLLCQSPFKGDDEDEIFNAIENDVVKYPISMPRQTVLVLQALLTKDPTQRLGASERDAEEIMEHPYFADVDFDDVLNLRIPPPYTPEISSEHDYSNFDQEFTSETPRLTPVETLLTSEMQEQFRGFSHISENAAV